MHVSVLSSGLWCDLGVGAGSVPARRVWDVVRKAGLGDRSVVVVVVINDWIEEDVAGTLLGRARLQLERACQAKGLCAGVTSG